MALSRRDLLARISAAGGSLLLGAGALRSAFAQGYTDTPFLPGGKWRVHDKNRPQPTVVTPGATNAEPPSDAVVLFDGKDLSKWKSGAGPAKWKVQDGYFQVVPATGPIQTKDEFGDCQLHIEFSCPNPPTGADQGRGNSGVFLFDQYEFQVLDCYENKTYADGMPGGIYGQTAPLVNACRKPGEWSVYDIVFVAPRFAEDGTVIAPAVCTVFLNGVLVQHATQLIGAMAHRVVGKYKKHGLTGPLSLQDHGNPVRFRNIWIRPIGPYEEVAIRPMMGQTK